MTKFNPLRLSHEGKASTRLKHAGSGERGSKYVSVGEKVAAGGEGARDDSSSPLKSIWAEYIDNPDASGDEAASVATEEAAASTGEAALDETASEPSAIGDDSGERSIEPAPKVVAVQAASAAKHAGETVAHAARDLRHVADNNFGRVYSGIRDLPTGFASENLTPGCLVLEGGAFRGLYSGGVIDALMEADINFQATVGVSAGALYGFCYTGAQIGSARINLRYRHDTRYVGARALLKNHGIIGWDFLFGRIQLQTPEERKRFYDDRRRFVVVATNVDTGEAEYLEKGDVDHRPCADIVRATCASASMPYVSKPVWVGARRYLDGGCADKIPFQWAIDEGYEKIIVIRTREKEFRKDSPAKTERLAHAAYGKDTPAFAKTFGRSDFAYNEQCDRLEELEREGRVLVIYPSEPVEVSRLEKDMEKLGSLYHLGYDDTIAKMDEIRAYLAR